MFIESVTTALNKFKVVHAIVGGHAVALHGAVRGTLDIDIIVKWTEPNLLAAERALESIGLTSRLPVDASLLFKMKDEYIANRNLIAWNFYNPTNPIDQVDIVITHSLSSSDIQWMTTRFGKIAVLKKQALILMKEASGRPQDIEDINALRSLT